MRHACCGLLMIYEGEHCERGLTASRGGLLPRRCIRSTYTIVLFFSCPFCFGVPSGLLPFLLLLFDFGLSALRCTKGGARLLTLLGRMTEGNSYLYWQIGLQSIEEPATKGDGRRVHCTPPSRVVGVMAVWSGGRFRGSMTGASVLQPQAAQWSPPLDPDWRASRPQRAPLPTRL